MKALQDKKKIWLYVWITVAFLILWTWHDVTKYPGQLFSRALNNLWRMPVIVVLNFIVFEYFIPYIRPTVKRILISILLIWVFMMLYSFGLYLWRNIGVSMGIYTPLGDYDKTEQVLEAQFAYSVSSLFFYGIIRHIYNYVRLKQTAQRLQIEKQAAELNYLKSQTNPHFLFNTLNNIYSLARDKSDLAAESVLRLSKILRFMLYEAGGAYIAIEQELKIMDDYIALEKLRYDESLRVNFNYDVEDMRQSMPPLLMIPLIENAFKHGVSETRNQPFVDIHLAVNKRQLTFLVKNSSESPANETGVKENIGLSNLRRQLELLYREYDLSLQQSGYVFIAQLKINLASHV